MKNDRESKATKYSNRGPIDLDSIAMEEVSQALKEFAGGSPGLEKCLRILWQRGIKTHSCCPGNNRLFDIAYIVMAEGEDVFCYLSDRLLNSDGFRIDIVDDKEVLKISGNEQEKESAFAYLAQDLSSERKNNRELVNQMIGVPFPNFWVRKVQAYDSNLKEMHWGGRVYIKRKL